jgi:hypothetical protein
MPMTKADHSANVKVKAGQPGALSLLSRTPMLSPGNAATSTQLPFSALHELFFQCGPADLSVSATVNSTPSYVIRGPIPKINRRSSGHAGSRYLRLWLPVLFTQSELYGTGPMPPSRAKIILRHGTRACAAPHEDEETPSVSGNCPRVWHSNVGSTIATEATP